MISQDMWKREGLFGYDVKKYLFNEIQNRIRETKNDKNDKKKCDTFNSNFNLFLLAIEVVFFYYFPKLFNLLIK